MIELDHEQLIYLRNTLTWLKQYVPVSYTHLTLPTTPYV